MRRYAEFAARAALGLGCVSVSACLDREIEPLEPRTTRTVSERVSKSVPDKIDLLLAIDNSSSMADKQSILALAVPDLVERLINPRCIDPSSGEPIAEQPDIGASCPEGAEREFLPIADVNVGVISSSLGDFGSGFCPPNQVDDADDAGHLLERGADGTPVDTYDDQGFLAWDPGGDRDGETSKTALLGNVTDLVAGVGQAGCGAEAQLESIVRFLVDPAPYASAATSSGGVVTRTGVDDALLAQRHAFLRPDSLVAIVVLSDENDCSVDPARGARVLAKSRMPRARAVCADAPGDACCASCAEATPGGCAEDPTCEVCDGSKCDIATLGVDDDPLNLRCFDQKRRFGREFLYPVARYVNALSLREIDPFASDFLPSRSTSLVANPLFEGPNGEKRATDNVFFAGIVGVPWQSIARRNAQGEPDLLRGLDALGDPRGGFMTADELTKSAVWDQIVGDVAGFRPPSDPLMRESPEPRTGSSPSTGTELSPPSAVGSNPVNGNERTNPPTELRDLQFACIFPLPGEPRTCEAGVSCDCPESDSPLCAGTTQTHAKAYPSLRELAVIQGLGSQGIAASVCPAQTATEGDDFGYRPAVRTIGDRLRDSLGGQCLSLELTPDSAGAVSCAVIEARHVEGDTSACCDLPGRSLSTNEAAIDSIRREADSEDWNCFCDMKQLGGDDLVACQNDPSLDATDGVDGYCYIDGSSSPPVGNPDLVKRCATNEKRLIRLVGATPPRAVSFITCVDE